MIARFHLLVVCVLALGCAKSNEYVEPPPPKVTVAKPLVQTVPVFLEETGETEAAGRTVVRTQVAGILEEIKVDSGSLVEEGDVLFEIDKGDYLAERDAAAAAVEVAKASVSTAEAKIKVAKAKLDAISPRVEQTENKFQRFDALLKTNGVSRNEWDVARADRDEALADQAGAQAEQLAADADLTTAEAQVSAANAQLEYANLNLSRTDVKAKSSGIVTYTIRRGTLLETGNELAIIVGQEKTWANFFVTERFLLQMENSTGKKTGRSELSSIPATLRRTGDKGYPFKGSLHDVAPEIDQATGTLAVQAEFDTTQDGRALLPGMFVRVRVEVGQIDDAVLIPQEAVARDTMGAFVFVLGSDNLVEKRPVTLGSTYERMIIVEDGLSGSEPIVILGIQRVRDGSPVTPKTVPLSPVDVPKKVPSGEPQQSNES